MRNDWMGSHMSLENSVFSWGSLHCSQPLAPSSSLLNGGNLAWKPTGSSGEAALSQECSLVAHYCWWFYVNGDARHAEGRGFICKVDLRCAPPEYKGKHYWILAVTCAIIHPLPCNISNDLLKKVLKAFSMGLTILVMLLFKNP